MKAQTEMNNLEIFGSLGQQAETSLLITKEFLNTNGMPFEFVLGKLCDTIEILNAMLHKANEIVAENKASK